MDIVPLWAAGRLAAPECGRRARALSSRNRITNAPTPDFSVAYHLASRLHERKREDQGLIRVPGELPRFGLVFVRPRSKMRGFFFVIQSTYSSLQSARYYIEYSIETV